MSLDATTTVSSEIHQDLLFLDAIAGGVFQDDEGKADGGDEGESGGGDKTISTTFVATPPPGSQDQAESIEIKIDHFRSTSVSLVGQQVWRGALLLGDLLLSRRGLVEGRTVLELAAGTGITSVAAAKAGAKTVIGTDVDRGDILKLLSRNLSQNVDFDKTKTTVCELDFFDSDGRKWKEEADLREVEVIIAADVVYDKEITQAFFSTLELLLLPTSSSECLCPLASELLLAVEERRRVEADGSVAAPNFEHFARLLGELEKKLTGWELLKLPLDDFHQHFGCYERTGQTMHLWRAHRGA